MMRFYDLDRHIIEVDENMNCVCCRFLDSDITEEKVAAQMDVPMKFVTGHSVIKGL